MANMEATSTSSGIMINRSLEWFGDLVQFSWKVICAAFAKPLELREIFRQLDEVGSKSFPLVALAGAAVGTVLALESRASLLRFGAKSIMPVAVVFAIIHEMGPIVTGLVVAGRVGAGIGAELGSMRVTEQIDALEASAVNPYKLLVFSRVLACIVALPLLTLVTDFCGVFAGWITVALSDPISFNHFLDKGFAGVKFSDFLAPTFRTCAFGLIIGLVSCFQGMRTRGGTEGVGRSATSSVVLSSLFVILADVILVKLILILFP